MGKLDLPKLQLLALPQGVSSFAITPTALARWNAALAAKEKDDEEDENTISIYDVIGGDPFFGVGVTAKRIAAALRSIGPKKTVAVNINSPGGDLFEGAAIYNLLRDYDGEVVTRVVGLAASAASVIAMAGAKIQAARMSAMMIHNVWVMAIGNRNDLRDAADQLDMFDDMLADAYARRTGKEKKDVAKLMDKETWFSGERAIEDGFADELLPADLVEEKDHGADVSPSASIRAAEIALMKTGMSRAHARAHINRIKESGGTPDAAAQQTRGKPDAAPKATPDAGAVEAKSKPLLDSFTESLTVR